MPHQITNASSVEEIPASNHTTNAPDEKTESQEEADRLYEEHIEEEYSKREGGA
ncbi:hypothetical protein BJ878DRAFT_429466 [Calycina marina]|uniref:Uncharacterized protein n=1 Tax=Calycina marina TaxID=1763456 RepID=A0A9P7YW85_9HELO|nr:hypothetical protein BJ878DRAFT_429466 [Calycina marina]